MEEKHINKKITFSIVAVLLIVLVTIGATYAYFSAQAQTEVQTVTTGTLTMEFTNGEIINATGIVPINDNEIKTKATSLPFSITNTGSEHMNITIKLTDITIDDALKDIDFRWGLYNADTDKGISFGIFKYSETGKEEIIYRDSIIDAGSPKKNYILRIWLHDDGALQNEMQGKTFSAKVTVTGEAIEYTPESCFTMGTEEDGTENTIIDYSSQCPKDVVIPRTINSTSVTTIGNGVFSEPSGKLTSVIIPDTVTTIDGFVFYESRLTHVTIPESVTKIGDWAFAVSPYLESVIIPESVTSLPLNLDGESHVFGETNIKSIIIPGSVKKLNAFTFSSTSLTDIILMHGITTIGGYDFGANYNLTSIEIPSSVTHIYENAFGDSTNLKEIVVRGKTEAPAGFAENWNCVVGDWDEEDNYICSKYANVIYRP